MTMHQTLATAELIAQSATWYRGNSAENLPGCCESLAKTRMLELQVPRVPLNRGLLGACAIQVVPHLDLRAAQQLARGALAHGTDDVPVDAMAPLGSDLQSVVASIKKSLYQPKRATLSRKLRHVGERTALSSGRNSADPVDVQEQYMQHAVVELILEELMLDAEADEALRLEEERTAAEVPTAPPPTVGDGSMKKKKKKGFCSIF